MIVLSKIGAGEDPLEVPLVYLQFWIQLFGVPSGLMTEVVQTDFQGRIFSEALSSRENNQGFNSSNKDKAVLAANFKSFDGPSEEELTGLNLEESNKRKRGPNNNSLMEIEGGYDGALSETGLSNADCPVSSTNVLATLARQASHLQ
ncbi:hypothetical protein ACET3Z_020622 [Daucus carota]